MSFIHLLAAGPSFKEINDRPSAYRMAERNWLPKFGVVGASDARSANEVKSATTREVDPVQVLQASAVQSIKKPIGRWDLPAKAIAPVPVGSSVRQTVNIPMASRKSDERLSGIKVVRNDLRDADLEVVRVTAETQAAANSAVTNQENLEVPVRNRSDRHGWSALAARLFQVAGSLR